MNQAPNFTDRVLYSKSQIVQLPITNRTYVTGPEPNGGEGPCGDEARRSAEEPEAPSEAPKHIRAVMRSTISDLLR
jgi:hypothetical protein